MKRTSRNIIHILGPLDAGQQPPIQLILDDRQVFAAEFWGWALHDWLILMSKHTPRNIMCILEPLDGGQQPPIQLVLDDRQFFAAEFSGVGTVRLAHIIVNTCSREYNVCFRTIGRWLPAPNS